MVILSQTDGTYVGLVPTAEAHAPELDADAATRLVRTLARWRTAVLTPALSVKEAMAVFDHAEAETLCVVDDTTSCTVVGMLTETYASRRYAEELDKANRSLTGEDG
jgi:CIC family chloride channel protein